jgi:copper ion binding protein
MKKIINIEGMSCDHCVGRINKALSEVEGINEVVVNLEEKKAEVTLEKNVADEKLKSEIENLGFNVMEIKSA